MSKIRVTSNPMQTGKNGASTYYVTKGSQIVRPARNNSNYGSEASRTPAQQARRILWANIVNLYKVSSFWMPRAFENTPKDQSDYNRFMGLNMKTSRVALTKSEAEVGACVVESVKISQGSLPAIQVTEAQHEFLSSVDVGSDITFESTVAEASRAIIANNSGVYEGMQLSFIYYMQYVDAQNVPRVKCFAYEMTLSLTDTERTLGDCFPANFISIVTGFLAVDKESFIGGGAFIWSETTKNGRINVSTQSLFTLNDYLLEYYTSAAQHTRAAESYGVGVGVFLQKGYYSRSGGRPVIETEFNQLNIAQLAYAVGEVGPRYVDLKNTTGPCFLTSDNLFPAGQYSLDLYFVEPFPSLVEHIVNVSATASPQAGLNRLNFSPLEGDVIPNAYCLTRAVCQVGVLEYYGVWQRADAPTD